MVVPEGGQPAEAPAEGAVENAPDGVYVVQSGDTLGQIAQGITQTTLTQKGIPHHAGNPDARTHGGAGTTALHINPELQAAQAMSQIVRGALNAVINEARAALLKGSGVLLRQNQPFIKIAAWGGELHGCQPRFRSPGNFM